VRVSDQESFLNFRKYIQQNPVKAGLVDSAELYPYSYTYLARKRLAGAKALIISVHSGTTKVVP
jgi:hypothetical protein